MPQRDNPLNQQWISQNQHRRQNVQKNTCADFIWLVIWLCLTALFAWIVIRARNDGQLQGFFLTEKLSAIIKDISRGNTILLLSNGIAICLPLLFAFFTRVFVHICVWLCPILLIATSIYLYTLQLFFIMTISIILFIIYVVIICCQKPNLDLFKLSPFIISQISGIIWFPIIISALFYLLFYVISKTLINLGLMKIGKLINQDIYERDVGMLVMMLAMLSVWLYHYFVKFVGGLLTQWYQGGSVNLTKNILTNLGSVMAAAFLTVIMKPFKILLASTKKNECFQNGCAPCFISMFRCCYDEIDYYGQIIGRQGLILLNDGYIAGCRDAGTIIFRKKQGYKVVDNTVTVVFYSQIAVCVCISALFTLWRCNQSTWLRRYDGQIMVIAVLFALVLCLPVITIICQSVTALFFLDSWKYDGSNQVTRKMIREIFQSLSSNDEPTSHLMHQMNELPPPLMHELPPPSMNNIPQGQYIPPSNMNIPESQIKNVWWMNQPQIYAETPFPASEVRPAQWNL